MTINFPCGQCGQRYTVGDDLAGRKIRCKKCQAVLLIPHQSAAPAGGSSSRALAATPPDRPSAADAYDLPDEPASAPDPEFSAPLRKKPGARGYGKASAGLWDDPKKKYLLIGGGGLAGLLVLVLLGSLIFRARGGGGLGWDAHERLLKDGIAILNDLSGQFGAIQDEAGAREAAPKARSAATKLETIGKTASSLPPLSPPDRIRLRLQYASQMDSALDRWRSQVSRVKALPGAAEALSEVVEGVDVP